ncbi:MarR family winged helix-turn-helix transcriptional regulator [Ruegeria lacuscaerulensis]|uniref:MarR family winged helix-turn-helix transcriptional regulator n=1 Tax=Ruegeria lacuscaerulensis TaxID=55218 RepID=UPI00147B6579|nr:MarR family transcriptional regulator [Ruegeria lacuscaerulensis]
MTQDDYTKKDDFDLLDFLPYLLNRAAEESSLEFQNVYNDRYGMLRTEWRVLFHLGIYGELTATEIGERAKIHKTKVSRAVNKLEARRFLARARSEADRRVEQLTLTPIGLSVYRELRGIAQQYDAKLAAMFSAEETAVLRKMLRRLADIG